MTKREAIHKELTALYQEGAKLAVDFQKKEDKQFQGRRLGFVSSTQRLFRKEENPLGFAPRHPSLQRSRLPS